MSIENLPERGVRKTTDAIFLCPNRHPILFRGVYISKQLIGGSFMTYPWNYSSELVCGETALGKIIPLLTRDDLKQTLSCPHCPEGNTFNINLAPIVETIISEVLKIKTDKY